MENNRLALAEYYRRHYPAFAHDLLKIRLEEGGIGRLTLNDTQLKLHDLLETQKAQTGKVRAIVLKPRREGLSTYIAGRFYHQTIFNHGLKTLITSHYEKSTDVLFEMVKLFQREMPDGIRPETGKNSATSLEFVASQGAYSVSTAGNPEAKRGDLAHLFHGSEVAYWRNAEDVVTASLETVGNKAGTEIVLESTGAPNTLFAEMWHKAVAGNSEFMPIFFPWYLSNRNRADATHLIPTAEEKELMRIYAGMDLENIAFRRMKLGSISETKFRREYPATPADAFIADHQNAFISPEVVQIARNRNLPSNLTAPRIIGFDPSQTADGDKCALVLRVGTKVEKVAQFNRETVQERADVVRRFFSQHDADHLFIDQGGSGKEIYDLLRAWGMNSNQITLVPFGAKASNSNLYPNKRNEIYTLMRNWLKEEGQIPNMEALASELSMTQKVINNNGQEVLQSKKEMRQSPNMADALALTFAYPVRKRSKPNYSY